MQRTIPDSSNIPRRVSMRGFTLIEIVVVLAIIGTMIAVIGFNLSNDTDRLARLEAERFLTVVGEVRDEAILVGENFFLLLDEKSMSYKFEGVRADRSTSLDDGLLRERIAGKGVELQWEVLDDLEDDPGDDRRPPRVLITALGEITPFDAWFSGDEYEYHVFVNDENQLEQKTSNGNLF